MIDHPFTERVHQVVRQIPAGKVATYSDVAALAGDPAAARAVGAVMASNPDPVTTPCHRVVGSDGRMHGYAFGGVGAKLKLLHQEGVALRGDRVVLGLSRWESQLESSERI